MKQFLVILTLFLGLLKTNAQVDTDWFVTKWDMTKTPPNSNFTETGDTEIRFGMWYTNGRFSIQYKPLNDDGSDSGSSWTTPTYSWESKGFRITGISAKKFLIRAYGFRSFNTYIDQDSKKMVDAHRLVDVVQWGTISWNAANRMFYNAVNLDISATDIPDFSQVRNMNGMFAGASSLVGNSSFADWDVSNVDGMQSMFEGATSFNQDISNWNVKSTLNAKYMFRGASSFDPEIVTKNYWANVTNNTGWTVNAGTNLPSKKSTDWFVTLWDTTKTKPAGIETKTTTGTKEISVIVAMPAEGAIQYQKADTTTPDQWETLKTGPIYATEHTILTFPTAGQYRVRFSKLTNFHSYVVIDDTGANDLKSEAFKLLKVEQWGTSQWASLRSMFYDAVNMNVVATDKPNLSATNLDATNMFFNTPKFIGDASMNDWDTSKINSTNSMFYGATQFNQNIGKWNVTQVLDMESMFYNAKEFNQDISNWNPWRNTTLKQTFYGAEKFNQPIGKWPSTGRVTTLESTFQGAKVFNQPLNDWKTASVTNMVRTFYGANEFNQPLNNWNTANVTNMFAMFYEARKFNQDLNTWNTRKVGNMSRMFYDANVFNGDITNWDTGNVFTMEAMFYQAYVFNQDISSWNTGKVTKMNDMFHRARVFNQPIDNWNVAKVTTMVKMFAEAEDFNQNIGNWDTESLTSTENMFYRAYKFNQYIGDWKMNKLTNVARMFYAATRYNQSMAKWDISNVVSFEDALSYSNMSPYNLDDTLAGWKTQTLSSNLPAGTYTGGSWTIGEGGVRKLITSSGLTNIRYCNQENIDAMVAKNFEIQATKQCGEIGLTYLETPNDIAAAASHKVLVGVKKTNGVDAQGKPLGAFEWLEEYDGTADTSEDLGMTKMFDDKVHSYSKGERDNLKEFPHNPSFTQKRYPLANLPYNSGVYNVQVIDQTEQVDGQDWELGKVVYDATKNHFYQGTNQGWERLDN